MKNHQNENQWVEWAGKKWGKLPTMNEIYYILLYTVRIYLKVGLPCGRANLS